MITHLLSRASPVFPAGRFCMASVGGTLVFKEAIWYSMHIHSSKGASGMEVLSQLNSPVLYLICGGIVLPGAVDYYKALIRKNR